MLVVCYLAAVETFERHSFTRDDVKFGSHWFCIGDAFWVDAFADALDCGGKFHGAFFLDLVVSDDVEIGGRGDECNLIDLTQFLYEFYWTPFLHRISTLDITPDESSNKLRASIVIEGLTINFRTNPRQAYPLLNQLPLDANPPKQLASGPFAAYKALGDLDVFRAVRTGIDRTKLLLLSGVPTITDDSGNSVTVSRWRLESEDRVITLKVGDDLKIDSFVGTVVDIDDDFVALRQSNGLLWVVLLGRSLGDAIAIPPNLF